MAKRRRKQARRRDAGLGSALRPVAWSALLGAAVATAATSPSYAAPARPYTAPASPAGVPDTGSRPTPAGPVQMPGAGPVVPRATTVPTAPTGLGPLAAQIQSQQIALAATGDRLLRLRQEQAQARTELAIADRRLREARDVLRRVQETADQAAAEALKDAAALPPGAFGSNLHDLGALARINRDGSASQQAAARELASAQEDERVAAGEYAAALGRERTLTTEYTTVDAARRQQESSLLRLRRQNTEQIARIERSQEAADQRAGSQYIGNESIAGKAADPRALAALRYALAQLGDRYVWATEGPDTFDCSGLMWAAYRTAAAGSYTLPRVAADQYYATRGRAVDRRSLLPGDLIFFSSSNSWTGIHHVGMYVGGGRMVHAPNSNEVVKISPVWWSHFFAATRVYGPVKAPTKPPTTKPVEPTKPPTTEPTKPPTSPPTKPPTKPPTAPPTKPPTAPPTTAPPPATPTTAPPPAAPTTSTTPSAPALSGSADRPSASTSGKAATGSADPQG